MRAENQLKLYHGFTDKELVMIKDSARKQGFMIEEAFNLFLDVFETFHFEKSRLLELFSSDLPVRFVHAELMAQYRISVDIVKDFQKLKSL
jgi:hypothetical protein